MAEAIRRSENKKISLPNIKIESTQLIDILSEIFHNGEAIRIEADSVSQDSIYLLNGLEDIRSNISLISGDVHATVNGISLHIGRNGNFLQIDRSDLLVTAKTLEKKIISYRSWLDFAAYYSGKLSIYWNFLYIFILLNFAGFIQIPIYLIVLVVSGSVILLFGSILLKAYSYDNQVFFLHRETFWDRNKDKVILSGITGFLGLLIGGLARFF